MTEVKQKITNKVQQSSKQKAQNAQAGGPTISGVAGVGKQKTVTRPESSRRPTVVHGHTTGPSASGIGEDKENEFTANRQVTATIRGKMKEKLVPKKGAGMSAYYDHNANKSAIKEDGGAAMSVGSGGAVPSITNATTNYAFQVKRKVKDKVLARRQKPNQVK